MNAILKICFIGLISTSVLADPPPGPYNQSMTYNQNMQYGSTNWYSSPLGQGAAMAGVAVISGLVNAMSRPDPVQYVQQQQQPIYVGNNPQQVPQQQVYNQPRNNGNCSMQTLYDRSGNPRYVKICD